MKKFGFTLAEVLITLGIIGVVAAITLPTLRANTVMATIGPKLGKAVAVFEQANQALLTEQSVDSLTDTDIPWGVNNNTDAAIRYMELLSLHLKMTTQANRFAVLDGNGNQIVDDDGNPVWQVAAGDNAIVTKDGILIWPNIVGQNLDIAPNPRPPHLVRFTDVFIDINGEAQPNLDGVDRFAFGMARDGSLVPFGTTYSNWDLGRPWTEVCPRAEDGLVANDLGWEDLRSCTGHVFENNMKAEWEFE